MSLPPFEPFSPDAEYEEQTRPLRETFDKSMKWMREHKIPVDLNPPVLTFPSTDMPRGQTPEEYAHLYETNVSWYSYILNQKAIWRGQLLAAENVLELVRSQLFIDYRKQSNSTAAPRQAGSLSVEDIKARILVHPRYRKALEDQQLAEQLYQHLNALSTVLEQNLAAISRQITIRGQDLLHGSGNVPQGGYPAHSRRPPPAGAPGGRPPPRFDDLP